jgi:hypothetical protein
MIQALGGLKAANFEVLYSLCSIPCTLMIYITGNVENGRDFKLIFNWK